MENLSVTSASWTVAVFASFLFSVCLHEFGHAVVAYWGGDRSVKEKGYLTLNPLKYTHPTYSIVMPLIFLLLGGIPLPGAAVYINIGALRTRAWQSAVSAAGPFATFLIAGAIAWLLRVMQPDYLALLRVQSLSRDLSGTGLSLYDWLIQGLVLLLTLEVAGVFLNLMPIPGLDGYGILEPWFPIKVQQKIRDFSRYGILILFGAFWLIPSFNQGFWSLVYGTVQLLGVPPAVSPLGFYLFRQGAQLLFFILLVGLVIFNQWKKRQPQAVDPQSLMQSDEALEQELETINQQLILTQNAGLLVKKGTVLINLERYEDALVALDQSLTLKEDDPNQWALKGYLCYLLHRESEAIAAYQKALQLEPSDGYSWQGLGMVHCEAKEYDAAIAAYNQALKYVKEPQNRIRVLSLKSRAFFYWERYQDSLKILEDILSRHPNNDLALYHQACCYGQLGEIDKGINCLAQISPGNDSIWQDADVDPDIDTLRSHPNFAALLDQRNPPLSSS